MDNLRRNSHRQRRPAKTCLAGKERQQDSGRRQSAAGDVDCSKSERGKKSVNAEKELSILKEKIEKMKETYKGAQDYEYEYYKKYNEEGNTVAANRALGKSYAFEAIYTYIKNM